MTPTKRDEIWQGVRKEVEAAAAREPMLTSFLSATILNHDTLEDALSFHLASMLGGPTIHSMSLREVIQEAYASDRAIGRAMRADIRAVRDRDPACVEYSFFTCIAYRGPIFAISMALSESLYSSISFLSAFRMVLASRPDAVCRSVTVTGFAAEKSSASTILSVFT